MATVLNYAVPIACIALGLNVALRAAVDRLVARLEAPYVERLRAISEPTCVEEDRP